MSTLLLKLTSDSSVRGVTSPDGMQRFSVYDFITVACQKSDGGAYARKTYSNLVKEGSDYKEEIENNVLNLHFPGGRGAATPTMTLRGLQRLLLILGGKVASEFRVLLEGTFTRLMAGDPSLIEVIRSNATSDAPLQQAYRQALAQEPVESVLDEIVRKRKMEEDSVRFELEVQERRIACVERFASVMSMLDPDWKSDARLCLQVKDSLKNALLNKGVIQAPAIGNGQPPLTQSLTIGEMAQRMGYALKHADQVVIGKLVAKAYFQRHGRKPSKCRRWVDGAEREVNAYTEGDKDLIEAAIRERMERRESEEGSD